MTAERHAHMPAHRYSFLPPVALIVLLLLVPLVASTVGGDLQRRMAIDFLINVLLVVALQIFVGNSGIISFGHASFMGLGAYASVILTIPLATKDFLLPGLYSPLDRIELPFVAAVAIAAMVAGVVAAAVGFPLMRLTGAGAAIATFALLVVIHVILINWPSVTRGTSPLFGVPSVTTVWVAYPFAALGIAVAYMFKESRLGLQLRSSREDERAAAAMGVNVVRVRWMAFVLSAALTGVAGAVWAHFITAFTAEAFFFTATFRVVTMLIVGGMFSVTGAVAGALVVSGAFQGLRALEGGFGIGGLRLGPFHGATDLLLAVAILLILIYRHRGILGDRELPVPGLPRR